MPAVAASRRSRAGSSNRQAQARAPYVASGQIKSGLPSVINKYIPNQIKACTTRWKEVNLAEVRFDILTDAEFNDKYNRDSIEEAYNHAATSLEDALQHAGLEASKASALDLLVSEEVFCKLEKYASQVLVLHVVYLVALLMR